ncbi:MAG: hypothetical protein WAW61_16090 [Methylococcaceae bacterium]
MTTAKAMAATIDQKRIGLIEPKLVAIFIESLCAKIGILINSWTYSRHYVRDDQTEGRSSVRGHNRFYAYSIARILLKLLPPPEENLAKSAPTEQGKNIVGWRSNKEGRESIVN